MLRAFKHFLPSAPSLPSGCAAGTFNFFPNHVHVNCTVGDCSFPSAWSEQNQTAYTALGNTDGSALLTVAVQDYYPRAPVIYFSPGAWCDTSFINVTTDEIAAALPPTATRRSSHRRRLLFRALMADTASPPAQYNITTPCSLQQVTMKIGSNANQVLQPVAAESGATNVFKADLGTGLPDVSPACMHACMQENSLMLDACGGFFHARYQST